MSNPIRLSHSTLELFNSCERKFQHKKILSSFEQSEPSTALINGTAVDAGYAKFAKDFDAFRKFLQES